MATVGDFRLCRFTRVSLGRGPGKHFIVRPLVLPTVLMDGIYLSDYNRSRFDSRTGETGMDGSPIPPDLVPSGSSRIFTEETIPDAFQREHKLAEGTWGVLRVLEGNIRFIDP